MIHFLAILYYDYFLTLPAEVTYFWLSRNKITWASSFFFMNRYLSLLGHIPVFFESFDSVNIQGKTAVSVNCWLLICVTLDAHLLNLQLCETLLIYHQYYAVVMQLIVGGEFSYSEKDIFDTLIAFCRNQVICMMRVYALYNLSRRVLGTLIVIATASVVVACVSHLLTCSIMSAAFLPNSSLLVAVHVLCSVQLFIVRGGVVQSSGNANDDK